MDKLIQGVLRFRNQVRPNLWPSVKSALARPQPSVLLITCIDSRLLPDSFTSAAPGDMFVIRNAGNIFPHSKLFGQDHMCGERAALEVAFNNSVSHIAVCGHSDCKAMQCLHDQSFTAAGLRETVASSNRPQSPLVTWLRQHGWSSLTKFEQLECGDPEGRKVITFDGPRKCEKFQAIIDSENKLSSLDQLSQVNVLQQLQNLKSDALVKQRLDEGSVQLHALWFDLSGGEMHIFSKEHQRFIVINEENVEKAFGQVHFEKTYGETSISQ